MEPKEVEKNLKEIPALKTMMEEVKAFLFGAAEKKEEEKKEEKNEGEKKEEVKVEFNHEAHLKEYNEFKTALETKTKTYEDKFTAFESQIKTANDTITKQDEQLKKMFTLVELMTNKFNELPSAFSGQFKREGVITKPNLEKVGLEIWKD